MIHTTLKSWKNRHSINESVNKINEGFIKTKFNSHKWHNDECDILEGRLNDDTFITYGIYIKDGKYGTMKQGDEFMEIYTGSNYNIGSSKKSHSRVYAPNQIPAKYKSLWLELKSIYDEKYKGKEHIKESINKTNLETSNALILAKEMDFEYADDYFDYIVDSYVNGQKSQCKKLFNELNKIGKKDAILYIKELSKEVYEFLMDSFLESQSTENSYFDFEDWDDTDISGPAMDGSIIFLIDETIDLVNKEISERMPNNIVDINLAKEARLAIANLWKDNIDEYLINGVKFNETKIATNEKKK